MDCSKEDGKGRWIEMAWIERSASAVATLNAAWDRVTTLAHARWSAQSTVEYALVGALVVIAAAGALTILGGELNTVFTRISETLRTPH
jgi:Flp pilus assembly pilin Flp